MLGWVFGRSYFISQSSPSLNLFFLFLSLKIGTCVQQPCEATTEWAKPKSFFWSIFHRATHLRWSRHTTARNVFGLGLAVEISQPNHIFHICNIARKLGKRRNIFFFHRESSPLSSRGKAGPKKSASLADLLKGNLIDEQADWSMVRNRDIWWKKKDNVIPVLDFAWKRAPTLFCETMPLTIYT